MLPRDILQQVRRIHLRTSRLVDDVLAGAYHSTFKGRGMEFDEVREYLQKFASVDQEWTIQCLTDNLQTPTFTPY